MSEKKKIKFQFRTLYLDMYSTRWYRFFNCIYFAKCNQFAGIFWTVNCVLLIGAFIAGVIVGPYLINKGAKGYYTDVCQLEKCINPELGSWYSLKFNFSQQIINPCVSSDTGKLLKCYTTLNQDIQLYHPKNFILGRILIIPSLIYLFSHIILSFYMIYRCWREAIKREDGNLDPFDALNVKNKT